jgi:2-iminobutanoate/2-iminopropanoate deaminase
VLEAAGMTMADIVRVNGYLASRAYVKGYLSVRDQYIEMPAPAASLMIVLGFADPEYLVEVEVIAAAP